jgi:hypothetical protein
MKTHKKKSPSRFQKTWAIFVCLPRCVESSKFRNFSPIYSLDRTAREEDNSLELLVVEEVVEAPQRAGLSERVRVQIRIVAVNVAIVELNLVVERRPQVILELSVCKKSFQSSVESLNQPQGLHCSPATADMFESIEFMISWIDGSLLNSWL